MGESSIPWNVRRDLSEEDIEYLQGKTWDELLAENTYCPQLGDALDGRPARSARSNLEDPYFPLHPDGFEPHTIRRWRAQITGGHMVAEGIDG